MGGRSATIPGLPAKTTWRPQADDNHAGDVARVVSDAEKAGKAVATVRNIRALASGMFSKAIEWGYLDTNPAQGVRGAGLKVARDRFLQPDELPRFFAALAEEPNATMRDFILLALLTGARRANVCAMHWREIDLAAGNWRLSVTKNGTPQTVTLCPEAVEILKARQESTAGGYVFPGTGATGHMVEPKKGVVRIMERAGIPYGRNEADGVTLHDLRRTLGSWQARTGASLAIIGKSLNHKSQQATAIYARLDLDPVRASVNTATAAMLEAGGMKAVAEVVPIKSA
jgi:integrase